MLKRLSLSPQESGLLAFVLAVKVLLLLYAGLAHAVIENQSAGSLFELLDYWRRWDTPHYLQIAAKGYVAEGEARLFIVFFPMYPWLVRAMAWLVVDHYIAALLVSTLASLALALALYRLVALDYGADLAQRAVALLFVFPTSYFLHIAYTESLFLALVVGSALAARSGHWKTAGLLGLFAALTRVNGALLAALLACEAWRQWRENRLVPYQAWPILLIPIGILIYLGVNHAVFGDPLHFLEVQRGHWHKRLAPPWDGLQGAWGWVLRGDPPTNRYMLGVQEVSFAALAIVMTLISAFRLRPAYAAWMALNTLLFLSTNFMQSVPRYCLTLFPMMILLAQGFRTPMQWMAFCVGSTLLLALFSFQFSMGRWGF